VFLRSAFYVVYSWVLYVIGASQIFADRDDGDDDDSQFGSLRGPAAATVNLQHGGGK